MNKSIFYTILLLSLLKVSGAYASDVILVAPLDIASGGKNILEIYYDFDTECTAFTFDCVLPEQIQVLTNESEDLVFEPGFESSHLWQGIKLANGSYRFSCISLGKEAMPISGILLKLSLTANEDVEVGTVLNGSLCNIEFTTMESTVLNISNIDCEINIVDSHIILDEVSTELPGKSDEEVSLRVLRTIKANEWSTLCLPFSMTESQIYDAFGDDVKVAEFVDYETYYDSNDEIVAISVNFEETDLSEGLYANYPYMIKVAQPISSFEVNSILEPDEEAAVVEFDNGKRGKQRVVYGSFIGTYHADTVLPENSLFMSKNKFWYSAGKTKTKAFRAYLMFEDVLSDLNNGDASSKIRLNVDFNTTSIENLCATDSNNGIYTLQGVFVGNDIDFKALPRGMYIVHGTKKFINNK